MENINNFLEFARVMGVRPDDLFQTAALYEGTNMTQASGAQSHVATVRRRTFDNEAPCISSSQVLQTLDNLKRLC
jgi:hypothetical protein